MTLKRINSRWAETHGDTRLHLGERFVPLGNPRRSIWHWLAGCRGQVESDEHGLWFKCAICHRVSGFIDRKTMHRYADAEWEREQKARSNNDLDNPTSEKEGV